MTFKFIVSPRSVTIEYEAGSVEEGMAPLMDPTTAVGKFVRDNPDWNFTAKTDVAPEPTPTEEPKKRGRKPKTQPDPATASAPPPMPVTAPAPPTPGMNNPASAPPAPLAPPAPPAPALATPPDLSIPPFLQRDAAPVPPPPAPPVRGKLGPLVKADLEKRKAGSPDDGKALIEWLVQAGLVLKDSNWVEAMAVVEIATDEQLAKVAEALTISA